MAPHTIVCAVLACSIVYAAPLSFKARCLSDLVQQVPRILASQDPETGRMGSGVWIVNDQHPMLALAAVWATRGEGNPYHRSPRLLAAIMDAGDALIADQDETGQWVFHKKDKSTWGKIYMPWTYSRWIRTFELIRDAMPAPRREKWERALRLGYQGIATQLQKAALRNIPAHHAMGLYFASRVFNEPQWKRQAAEFLHRVAEDQHPDGYWSENSGPVVLYGTVYVEALGTYYAASRDAAILPALRKSSVFHSYFTYPNGADVETIDERNFYHRTIRIPNPGFTFSIEGRGFLMRQLSLHAGPLPEDTAASLLLWGEEGEAGGPALAKGDFDYVLGKGDAAVYRRGPWFVVVSAFTAPVPQSRWIQDRQNFVSVYHDKAGLILGGGNTKLQPLWSNFTLGDTGLLRHRPGDENPAFRPPPGLTHVPSRAVLRSGGEHFGVELHYGDSKGTIDVEVESPERLAYRVTGDRKLTAHLTAMPAANVRFSVPAGAGIRPNVLPHDPYKKDGRPDPDAGRVVVSMPLAGAARTIRVDVQ